MTEPFSILVSSAGRRVSLVEMCRDDLRALGLQGEVVAADMSALSSAFHAADRAFLVPACTEPGFISDILSICRSEAIGLVIPTIDPELPVYAQHREAFREAGVMLAISDPTAVEIGMDKELTHTWLEKAGVPTVRQAPIADRERALSEWGFPLVVKPRRGSASKGVSLVNDDVELELAVRKGGQEHDDLLLETVAPGVEHTVDVLIDLRGHVVCTVPRRRIEVRAGEVSKGVTVRSEPIERIVREACEALPGAYGPLTFQVFLDGSTGEINVIEMNPRFGGGFPLSWKAGARYPRWMLEEILHLPTTASDDAWKDHLLMLRYDEAVFVDAEEIDP